MRARTALIIDPADDMPATVLAELDRRGIAIQGRVGYGLQALETAFAQCPDLVLIRLMPPYARGIDLVARIHDALPGSVIIAVTDRDGGRAGNAAIAAGAAVCLPAGSPRGQVSRVLDASGHYFELQRRGENLAVGQGGQVITVLGAKGGVGKTTIATNLAIALQRESHGAVALIDADAQFGDVALALDLAPERSLADAAGSIGQLEFSDVREFMTPGYGIWVLAAPRHAAEGQQVTGEALGAVIARLRDSFDFVVVDTGGAYTGLTAAAADAATTRMLVTTPELNAVHDAVRAVRWLRERAGPDAGRLRLVENRAGMCGGLREAAFAREMGMLPACVLEDDRRLARAMQAGTPFVDRYPRSRVAVAIRGLAVSLLGGPGGIGGPPRGNPGRRALARLLPGFAWG